FGDGGRAALGDVVLAGQRGAVDGRIVEAGAAGTGGPAQADLEEHLGGARIALGHAAVAEVDHRDGAAAAGNHADVVDADPFVVAGGVRGHDPQLNQRLVVGVGGQVHRHRRVARAAGAAGVGDVGLGHVAEVADAADAVVQGDLLGGVVGRGVDVAQAVGHLDAARAAGVEVDPQVGRVRRTAALQRHHRIGDMELGHAAVADAGTGLVGDHVDDAGGIGAQHRLRVDPVGRSQVAAEVAEDAVHVRPVVV